MTRKFRGGGPGLSGPAPSEVHGDGNVFPPTLRPRGHIAPRRTTLGRPKVPNRTVRLHGPNGTCVRCLVTYSSTEPGESSLSHWDGTPVTPDSKVKLSSNVTVKLGLVIQRRCLC